VSVNSNVLGAMVQAPPKPALLVAAFEDPELAKFRWETKSE
jgi:hypothetical protein